LNKHVYIQIYFQADKWTNEIANPNFPQIPTIHRLAAKIATGNGNLQPEIRVESNEYSSSKNFLE